MKTIGYTYRNEHMAECPRCGERYVRRTMWGLNLVIRIHDLIKHGVPFNAEVEE